MTAAVAILAGCGGGVTSSADGSSGTGGSGSGAPGSNGGTNPQSTTCTTAPASFNAVWTAINAATGGCASCHLGSNTGLRFVGGDAVASYNRLREYVAQTGNNTRLLAKASGGLGHGGGAVWATNSQQYANLQAQGSFACPSTGNVPVTPASAFWNGVTLADAQTTLAKASMMFAGRNPSAMESQAVATGGEAALRTTVRSYMTGATFERWLDESAETHFLTPGVIVYDNNMGGLNAADFPGVNAANLINNPQGTDQAVRNRFQASIRREPKELVKFIVRNERPWTEMVAGNYTVVNGLIQQSVNASVQGAFTNAADDNEWRAGAWPSLRLGGMREHAGVLSSHAWLQRFPTTPTNRNRHRVYITMKQFLATDVALLAARPIESTSTFRVGTMEDPNCTVCHNLIDPIAAGFQNWNEMNRYLPVGAGATAHALPNSYRAANYPAVCGAQDGTTGTMACYRNGDNWFRDSAVPGYKGTTMPGGYTGNRTALQFLGAQVAGDPLFPLGATHFWYEAVFGRAPLKTPQDQTSPTYAQQLLAYNAQNEEFRAIATRFATNQGNGAYNVKDLLVDLVTSRHFRAVSATGATGGRALELANVGTANMLSTEQLQRKMVATLGQGYAGFNNPDVNEGLNFDNFDGNTRINRAKEYTMLQTTTMDRVAATMSCGVAQADFGRAVGARLLFPAVSMNDLPNTAAGEAAIRANIVHLHKWLLNETVSANDAEATRTFNLFLAVWNDRATAPARPVNCGFNAGNDPNYTGRAWAAVVAYMIGDAKFIFE